MWLSLVEHSVRDAGVGGSNPLIPTIFLQDLSGTIITCFFILSHNLIDTTTRVSLSTFSALFYFG